MRIKVLATVLILTGSTVAIADSGVLVDQVPAGADRTIVMSVVHQALLRHGWTIERTDGFDILASINGNKTDALITFRIAGGITYDGKATLTVASNAQNVTRPVRLPRRWVHTLQVDIGNALATMPQKPST